MAGYLSKKGVYISATDIGTESSPTYTGLTLSGLTASTVIYADASKAIASLANGSGYLLNDGSGGLSWAAVSLSGYLKADGTVPLTADWAAGAFTITAAAFTATGTATGSGLTATPTYGAELITGATAMSTWTPVTSWTWDGAKWDHALGSTRTLASNWSPTAGTKYRIVVINTTGTAGAGYTMTVGGQTFAVVSATGTNTYDFTAGDTSALSISAASWIGSITSVSVKEVTYGGITGETLTLNSGILSTGNGNAILPAYSFTNSVGSGMFYDESTSSLSFSTVGATRFYFSSAATYIKTSYLYMGTNLDLILQRKAAGTIQLGTDAATPIDQTLKAHDGVGTDKAGAMLTVQGGASTGTGAPGGWRVQTSTVAGTGSTANTYYDRVRVVGKVYSLSNNSATALFSVAVADGQGVGGKVDYTIEVTDGTDIQIESGIATFAGVNKAVETWTTDVDKGTLSQAASSGTLTVTWAAVTTTADTLKLTVNSNSSLTPTSTTLRYQIILNSPKVITIL